MAAIQHDDARTLLGIIASAVAKGKTLTYRKAAESMKRLPPENHSRAVAQMCDLLDAAACFAGVPLLALVAVRDASEGINPKAWKIVSEARRDLIIQRSMNHRFVDADIKAIFGALNNLNPRGNRAAWKFLEAIYPGDLLYRRVIGDYTDHDSNAIDDLGTDVPDRARSEVWTYNRDPEVRAAVLRRANGRCEHCGAQGFLKPNGTRYLESHHIIALADEGEDRPTNVIALCANDHREAHFGERAEELEKTMTVKLSLIACAKVSS